MDIKTLVAENYIWIFIIVGLILCFAGYRIFRILLIVLGFMAGAVLGGFIIFHYTNGSEIAAIFAGVLGGLIAAGLMVYLFALGVFLIGATVGLGIALFSFKLLMLEQSLLIMIIAALSGGLLAVFFRKIMVILATSLEGAWGVITGIAYLFTQDFNPLDPGTVFELEETQVFRITVSFLALSMVGFIYQYISAPVDDDDKEDNDANPDENNPVSDTLREPGKNPPIKTI